MLKTVEGIYRQGRIELSETPTDVGEQARVLITFLTPGDIDLSARGLEVNQARELRERLAPFAEEWDSPEMAEYDDYPASRNSASR